MTTREEITVELGVNNTNLGRGLAQADMLVGKFADKVTSGVGKKLSNFLFGGIAGLVVGFAHELISTESMGKFWDWVYGNDEAGQERVKKMQDGLRKIREGLESLKEKANKAREDYLYGNETNAGKQVILEDKINKNISEQVRLRKSIVYNEDILQGMREIGLLTESRRVELIEKNAQSEGKILELEIEGYELSKKDAALKREAAEDQLQYQQRIEALRLKDYADIAKFMPTIEELAKSGSFRREARQVGRIDRRIKREFGRGNVGGAIDMIGERNTIVDALSSKGVLGARNKLGADRAADALESIVKGEVAIKTKAKMG